MIFIESWIIRGDQIQLQAKKQGKMHNAAYWLLNHRARGYAETIIKESDDRVNLKQVSYTTCDPDNEARRMR